MAQRLTVEMERKIDGCLFTSEASFTTKDEARKRANEDRTDFNYHARVVQDWYGWTVLICPRKK